MTLLIPQGRHFFTLFFYTHACTKNTGVSVCNLASTGALSVSLMPRVHFIIVLSQIWNSNLRLVARPLQSERLLPQTTEEEHAKRCCAGQGSEMEDVCSVWGEQEPLTQMWWLLCRSKVTTVDRVGSKPGQ